MPAPPKKDYTQVTPGIITAYNQIRNVTKVARLFNMSPVTVKRLLDENKVVTGRSGVSNRRRVRGFDPESCHYCRKFSDTGSVSGYCLLHRRTVAGRNIEICFVK